MKNLEAPTEDAYRLALYSQSQREILQHHLSHLKKSGLTEATVQCAGIYSVTDPAVSRRLLNWRDHGPAPAIAFPHLDRTGAEVHVILRPDRPVARGNSAPKYEAPWGTSPRLYIPPTSLMPANWYESDAPLILTEGIKKSLAIVQQGVAAVSGQGVWVFHDTELRRQSGKFVLHPDFSGVLLKGRKVYIAFDGGDTERNPHVIYAEAALARLLLDAGAETKLIRVPSLDGGKVGIDDYLATQSDPRDALRQLMSEAIAADPMVAVSEIKTATQREMAAANLLGLPHFLAALKAGGPVVIDGVCKILRLAGISRTTVKGEVGEFSASLAYRTKANDDPHDDGEPPSPQFRRAADALLARPYLLQDILRHLANEGLVGESKAATAVLLACISRLLPQPLHIVIKAASSGGKNFLVRRVVACFPPGVVHEIADLSPKSLHYLKEGLKEKIVVINEHEGAVRAEYTLRVAMSEGSLKFWVTEKDAETGRLETKEHVVPGPACFVTTTTRAMLHDENETRVMEVGLDESAEQTGRIIEAQAHAAAHPKSPAEVIEAREQRETIRLALSMLKPYDVCIPQATDVSAKFSRNQVRRRRDFPKMLTLIAAHALLFQRQRQVVGERLIATEDDVNAAQALLAHVCDDVPPRVRALCRDLYTHFRLGVFSASEAAPALGWATDSVRRRLHELCDLELVDSVAVGRGNRPTRWRLTRRAADIQGYRTEDAEIVGESGLSDSPAPDNANAKERSDAALDDACGGSVGQTQIANTDGRVGPTVERAGVASVKGTWGEL